MKNLKNSFFSKTPPHGSPAQQKKRNEPDKENSQIKKGYGFFVYWNKLKKYLQKIYTSWGPREKYLIGLFLLIIIGSFLAIGVQLYLSNTQTQPAFGGEYREALIGLPRFLNPALSIANDVDRDLVQLLYSSLMKYDKNGNLVPDLAEKFEITDEGKEYRFVLKSNLKWEDGKPLDAQDVLFTIKLIQNSQFLSPLYQSWQGVSVSIEENNIVVFKLSVAYPPFLENTTIGILPRHIWQNVTMQNFALSDLNLQPIGSGPFKVKKFTKDSSGLISSYTLERNENYHSKKPYLNKIIFKFYSTEKDAIKAYNSRAVDGISFVSSTNLELIKDLDSLRLHEMMMPRSFAIFFNQENNELLKNKKIRKALNHATNKKELVEKILNGFAKTVDTPIPPNLTKYYNENIATLDYDIGKAREILKEEGWENLDNDEILEKVLEENTNYIKLSFTLVTASREELKLVSESLKEQWREAGILLNVITMDLEDLQQNYIRPRTYEMLLFGTILSAVPDPYPFWHSSQINDFGLNLAKYQNDDVDKLLEDARRLTSETRRIEKYKEFQKLITDDIPAIFLYDPAYLYPVNKAIGGIEGVFIVDTSNRFLDIENWYIETKRVF